MSRSGRIFLAGRHRLQNGFIRSSTSGACRAGWVGRPALALRLFTRNRRLFVVAQRSFLATMTVGWSPNRSGTGISRRNEPGPSPFAQTRLLARPSSARRSRQAGKFHAWASWRPSSSRAALPVGRRYRLISAPCTSCPGWCADSFKNRRTDQGVGGGDPAAPAHRRDSTASTIR